MPLEPLQPFGYTPLSQPDEIRLVIIHSRPENQRNGARDVAISIEIIHVKLKEYKLRPCYMSEEPIVHP